MNGRDRKNKQKKYQTERIKYVTCLKKAKIAANFSECLAMKGLLFYNNSDYLCYDLVPKHDFIR